MVNLGLLRPPRSPPPCDPAARASAPRSRARASRSRRGVANFVLVPWGRRGFTEQRVSTVHRRVARPRHREEFERPYGNLVGVQWFAQAAQRHMYEFGTTSEQFGAVAVACRRHANLNPQAVMHGRPMTLAEHQASRMITSPFRLFDCSLESDGAGAVVITSADRARDVPQAAGAHLGVRRRPREPADLDHPEA